MMSMLAANVKMTMTVANTKMTMMVANMCHVNTRTMMVVPRIHLHLMVRNEIVLCCMPANDELRHTQVLMVFLFLNMFYTSLLIY
jgi:hypothetical protein